MKELVVNQPTKNIVLMIQKMVERRGLLEKDDLFKVRLRLREKMNKETNELCYEILQKGTYTACILTINNEIVGVGMTKRNRNDKYNEGIAIDVSVHKAIKDYLFGIEPERIKYKND